jgi:mono/diheme cytochrome c family protein
MVSISSCRAMMKRHASGPRLRRIWLAATIAVPLFAAVILPAGASELTEQGQDIAQRLCSTCHGIGRAERSPMAAAPAFRRIEPRVDLDRMIERLQDGLIAGHPEMPVFVLKEQEARALVAYMRSLRDN